MKRISAVFLFVLYFITLQAQEPGIKNTRARFSSANDSLIVNYDLTGKRKAFDVRLHVYDHSDQTLKLTHVFGDIGDGIRPGINKTITWDLKADNTDVSGTILKVKVTGKVFEPEKSQKSVWIPWFYIAAGASTVTGTYAHIRSKQIFRDYPPSSVTDEAEKLHRDAKRMQIIRNIAFGTAGGFGIAGVVVHMKHIQKKKSVELSYVPLQEGAEFGLKIKF